MGFYEIAPPSIQEIMQNGLLDKAFQKALVPEFLWDSVLEEIPFGGGIGSTSVLTRSGLLAVSQTPTPVTGSDPTPSVKGFEQYSIKQDQWAGTMDVNMLESSMTLASTWIDAQIALATAASQTKNRLARNAIFGAYGEGQTWVTTASTSSTTLYVYDATGFQYATTTLATTNSDAAEGIGANATPVLAAVSGSNPLSITVNGTANTVTGVNVSTGALTLGTAISASVWQAVVNTGNGAVQYRPNGKASAAQLISTDLATLNLFRQAVARLSSMNVPRINGAYRAHVTPQTLNELFEDTEFQSAYRGLANNPAYVDMGIGAGTTLGDGSGGTYLGRFAGIDWFEDNELPVGAISTTGVQTYRCIVMGDKVGVKSPFTEQMRLLREIPENATGLSDITPFAGGTYRILRGPTDRLAQVATATWAWIGGYGVPTDLLTGDSAAYKRAVVIEHA